jgi:D-3-phosphoglycerate dehydrogenase
MGYKVYYADNIFDSVEIERGILARAGAELIVADCKTEDDVVRQCADADGLIVVYCRISHKALSGLPKCRVVVRTGIGYDALDVNALTEHGVCGVNIPDYCVQEVSDHALALVLACSRRVVQLDRDVRTGIWGVTKTAPDIQGLEGQVLGIVGLGKIGQRLSRHASAIGLRVLAFDPYVTSETAAACNARLVDLDQLMASADYVSVNAPLTAQTRHMISSAQLRQMKSSAWLVNTSRGSVVDEAALIEALQSGTLAGAALDVFETEPVLADSPLLQMKNVVLNPHAAYYSQRAEAELHRRVAEEVAQVLGGKYPNSLVNPAVKARLREAGRALAEV